MNPTIDEYRAALSTRQLIVELGRLFARGRRIEQLICRYLADLADRIEQEPFTVLGGYADIYHAARSHFGLSVRATRERVRVGRALRELPRIEQAFVEGRLGYSRVREVTRVARAETEAEWFEAARELPMRVLERRVVEAGGAGERGMRDDAAQAGVSWTTPETVNVTLRLGAEAWALLERAMEGARRAAGGEGLLTDAEALEAVARDALCRQEDGEQGAASDPRRNVVLYECCTCGRTEVDTGRGPIEVGDGAAAALGCGATVRDLRTEGAVVKRGGALPSQVKRAVRLRDRDRCRVPGCGRRRYTDVHHIDHQGKGGEHSRGNCCTLCTTHHRQLHEGELSVAGDADGELQFYDADGVLIGAPRGWLGVTQLGSSGQDVARAAGDDAAGHPGEDEAARPTQNEAGQLTEDEAAQLSPEAHQILRTMGSRGGWHADALCTVTGMAYREVSTALLRLALDGRVRQTFQGYEVTA